MSTPLNLKNATGFTTVKPVDDDFARIQRDMEFGLFELSLLSVKYLRNLCVSRILLGIYLTMALSDDE